ncbi:MAG: hypothetical protein E6L09_08790 [Verrucomicrobia bacterium]|nr:MAG: hypothetical protein E6L09_08790 [Verrucomicrobiota bacterium]
MNEFGETLPHLRHLEVDERQQDDGGEQRDQKADAEAQPNQRPSDPIRAGHRLSGDLLKFLRHFAQAGRGEPLLNPLA